MNVTPLILWKSRNNLLIKSHIETTAQFYANLIHKLANLNHFCESNRQNKKMGFWNRSSDEDTAPAASDFTSPDEASFSSSPSMSGATNYAPSTSGGAGAGAELKQFAVALQQQVVIQEVMNKLTAQAFERCISGKPGESLRGSEVTCIHASVGKWLDTNDFMVGRLAKKSQNQQQQF